MPKLAALLGLNRVIWPSLLITLAPSSCASVSFPYKYYNPAPDSYAGTLLGDKPSHDLPFSVCEPTSQSKANCVVLLTNEFFALMQDYLITKQALIDCQTGGPPK